MCEAAAWRKSVRAELLSFLFFPYSTVSPLTLLHVSLGTSKVLARYFQVGSLQGFGGVSVGVLQNCLSLLCEALLQSNTLEMSLNGEQQCVKKAF